MKFFLGLIHLSSMASAADYESMYFKATQSGVNIHLKYKELLGIKAFYDVSTNVRFKPVVSCENLGGYTFAHVTLEKSYLFRGPEKSRFRNGSLATSYARIKLKTHKLCDGEQVDVITVDGRKVQRFGSR